MTKPRLGIALGSGAARGWAHLGVLEALSERGLRPDCYSGASIGYQLASPLAGGLAPLIAAALLQWSGGQPWPVAVYLILLAAITIVSVWLAAETHRVELHAQK